MTRTYELGFPIFSAEKARAMNPIYFKTLSSTQKGINKAILGHLIADNRTNASYMVVRRSQRDPRTIMQLQTVGYPGKHNVHRLPRTIYVTGKSDYAITQQSWADGACSELHVYSSAKEARARLVEMTRSGAFPQPANTFEATQ